MLSFRCVIFVGFCCMIVSPMAQTSNDCLPSFAQLQPKQLYHDKILSQFVMDPDYSLSSYLQEYSGIGNSHIVVAAKAKGIARQLQKIPRNSPVMVSQHKHNCQFESAILTIDEQRQLRLVKIDNRFEFRFFQQLHQFREVFKSYQVETSLFVDGINAGIPQKILLQLEVNLSSRFDFQRDLRRGDRFSLLYEQRQADDGSPRIGNLLMATYQQRKKTTEIYRYIDAKAANKGALYVDGKDYSTSHSFLKNPLKIARISSHFNPRRFHPILKRIKAHKGTDFAAAVGTKIRATGDGTVILKKWHGGYGRTIKIQHGKKYQTLYAHMSRYAHGIKVGSKVSKGQVIGYVGNTGQSTGPHLHYEFIINGVHVNPTKVKTPPYQLNQQQRSSFKSLKQYYQRRFRELQQIPLARLDQP